MRLTRDMSGRELVKTLTQKTILQFVEKLARLRSKNEHDPL